MTTLVWLSWFGWYLCGLSPSLGGEDAGEFATVAATLGISHAPGYPLYALAGRLAAAIPLGSVAFRLDLLSAAAAAAADAALFALAAREARLRFGLGNTGAVVCGLVASLSFGLTRACWSQASISDKYAVNVALFSLVAAGMLSGRRWPALALLLGVSFAHHLQTLYLLPGLGWVAWRLARPSPRTALVCAVVFIAGFSPKLLYPPVRAAQDPALMLDRPMTWARQFDYLRARAYAGKVAGPSRAALWRDAAGTLVRETMLGAVAGPIGLVAWTARAGALGPAAWLTAATGFCFAASLDLTGREFYLLPVAWVLALGVGALCAWGWSAASRSSATRLRVVAVATAALTPVCLALWNAPLAGGSRLSIELDYGRNLLAGLPKRTVFFVSGDDIIYPTFYLQLVEGFRTDVVVIPEGFLSRPFTRVRLARMLPEAAGLAGPVGLRTEEEWSREVATAASRAGRPCALTNPSREGISAGLHREIRDLVYEVFRDRPLMKPGAALWMRTRGWHHDPKGLTIRQGWVISLYGKYQRQYADALANAGAILPALPRYRRALAVPDLPDREGAANNYALALERAGQPGEALAVWDRMVRGGARRPEAFLNAGNLLLGLGRREEAARMYEAALGCVEPSSAYAAYARRQLGRLR